MKNNMFGIKGEYLNFKYIVFDPEDYDNIGELLGEDTDLYFFSGEPLPPNIDWVLTVIVVRDGQRCAESVPIEMEESDWEIDQEDLIHSAIDQLIVRNKPKH